MFWVKRLPGLEDTEDDVNEFAHGGANDRHFGFALRASRRREANSGKAEPGVTHHI